MKATAVFLDRDGTIIEDTGYVGDPEQVRLLPGAAEAIRRLTKLVDVVVLASNQSGVARGLFDEEDLARVHERVEELLRQHGVRLDGAYYCPYLDGPKATVDAYRRASELRKPKPGMLLQAARDMNIDLSRSWMIGDSQADVEAGWRAGCQTVHLRDRAKEEDASTSAMHTAASLLEAAEILEQKMKQTRGDTALGAAQSEGEVLDVLRGISDRLDRAQRQQHQQDFSLLRLFGALLQMFAIVAAVWGSVALFDDRSAPATARFGLACFLQLGSLSIFAVDRFR